MKNKTHFFNFITSHFILKGQEGLIIQRESKPHWDEMLVLLISKELLKIELMV